jgi:hypothetical protein
MSVTTVPAELVRGVQVVHVDVDVVDGVHASTGEAAPI